MMQWRSRLLALAAVLGLGSAASAQAQVVISQVYGGGGNSGATWQSDFIELHNNGTAEVDLGGWSVQYASSGGTSWQVTPLSGSIGPGGYYLVKEADGSGGTTALPTPDASGTIAMSGTAGKVALSNAATALSGACPAAVDFVGFGAANCAEGSPTPTLSNTTAALRAGDGCTDTDDNSADFIVAAPNPRNSASAALVCGASGTPLLSIADASGDEGAGPLLFTLTLTQPAPADGVSVDWATADGSAVAGSDYVAGNGTVTLAEGQTSAAISVTLIDNDITEPDKTFTVNLSNLVGEALLGRATATGTIVNDDINLTPIHDIQGSGLTSPYEGSLVYTTGVVTARRGNGFWIQAPDAEADADPATSEGIYVYTGSTPPAAAAVGNLVRVSGTVQEYVPSADPYQSPLTEIVSPTVALLAPDQPLPAPVVLSADMLTPDGGVDQLENLEGMRVTVPSLTVVAPTGGYVTETTATSSSNGRLYAVISGTPRPFREPGIQAPTPVTGNIPQWDGNPEVLTIESTTLGGNDYALNLSAGATITGLTGPLDYSFRHFVILRDPSVAVDTVAGPEPRPARAPTVDEFTVAAYNMERFFDTVANGNGAPTLTADAFARRMSKASIAIRDYLRLPDVLAVMEMENIATLQQVADKVNAEAEAEGLGDPQYAPYLIQGNDIGGINVGFLVKTADAGSGLPRVEVTDIVQEGKNTTWTEPSGNTSLLNDRPPLVLDVVVNYADGRSFPVTVIAVHQRSLNGEEDPDPRVRAKRQAQAVFLANLVQGMQTADPERRIVTLGDFNAFEFNDGYTDPMNTFIGTPTPDDQTVVEGDGADLVDPDQFMLDELAPPEERYSYTYDGSAQSLDHIVVNEALIGATTGIGLDHARINGDFPETLRNDANSPARLSDHDPAVGYFELRDRADLAVAASANSASVAAGQTLSYTVSVANGGPDAAAQTGVGFAIDAALPDMAVAAPAGWSCDAPQISGDATSVACNIGSLANGAAATFAVTATATAAQAGTQAKLAVAATTQSFDGNEGNDEATASIAVTAASSVDLAVQLDGPASVPARTFSIPYAATLRNLGSEAALRPVLTFDGNTLTSTATVTKPAGWTCIKQGSARAASVVCSAASLAAGATAEFGLKVNATPVPASGRVGVSAAAGSASADADASNDTAAIETLIQ